MKIRLELLEAIDVYDRGAVYADELGRVQPCFNGFDRFPDEVRSRGDIYRNAASVRIDASNWVDYLQVAKWRGRWVIVNVLWELKPKS